MKFMNMMSKFYSKQEAATPSEQGGGGDGLTPPPLPTPPATPPAQAPTPATPPPAPAAPAPAPQVTTPVTTDRVESLANYVTQAGLSVEHVDAELDAYGKLSDVSISIIRQKHGEHADLVITSIEQAHMHSQTAAKEAQQQTYAEVASILGVDQAQGAQELSNMIEWLAKSEFAAQGGELADMIDAGGLSRTLALQSIANNYRAAVPAQLVDGEPPAPSNSQMTMQEYNRQLNELVPKYGYESPQVKALQKQRDAARRAGI